MRDYDKYIQILLVFTFLLPRSTREREERVNMEQSTSIPADSCTAPILLTGDMKFHEPSSLYVPKHEALLAQRTLCMLQGEISEREFPAT